MIDAMDRKILTILQTNARTSNAEIARQVGMAPSAILERIRKLEARGVIRGYEARLDPDALGLHLLAYVFVRIDDLAWDARAGEILAQIEGVQEVHHIAGEDCFLVKVRVPDAKTLGQLLRERFTVTHQVRSTRTTVVLETAHETSRLALPALPDEIVSHGPGDSERQRPAPSSLDPLDGPDAHFLVHDEEVSRG